MKINFLPQPHKFLTTLLCLLGLFLTLPLGGCDSDTVPPKGQYGVVATVDGLPISLQWLQAKHDFNNLSWSTSAMPSADDLQRQYGDALTELIIARLIEIELEKRDLAVSDAELKTAEDAVRADYPKDEFERSLVEDYIDIDIWRVFLRQRLATLKFIDTVLRPEITISPADMEAYYQKHIEDFTIPVREHFIVVDCESKEMAEKLRKDYLQSKTQPPSSDDGNINVREVTANEERLPQPWLEALSGLQSKEVSGIKFYEQRYQFIIFLDQLPKQVLDLTTAYKRVEDGLVESRMESAFNHWLERALKAADIRVSKPMLEAWGKQHLTAASKETQGDVPGGAQVFGNVTAPAPGVTQNATLQDDGQGDETSDKNEIPNRAPPNLPAEEGSD